MEEAFTQPEVRLNYDTGGDNTLTGFDRFGRVADQVWEQYGGQQPAAVDRFQYGYDSAGNRVWRKNVVAHGQSLAFDEVYGLDDLGRLIATERGYLQSVDPVSLTARAFEQEWSLDGTGNWAEFNEDLDGTGWDLEQTRQHNAANEVTGATDWAAPAHDRAGNMTAMPKPASPADALGATYDAWNRLVAVSEGGVLIAKFSYDAAGRRILKQLADAQEPDQYIHYYHSGQQVVETRAGDDSSGVPDPVQLDPAYQFVWSPRYIDALILRDQYDAQGQLDPGARLFYLADANFNVTGIVGLVETEPDVFEWQVVERYVYSPYGAVTIYTPDWSATRAESAFDNTTLYTGRELDPSTGLYYYRARYYHAQLGQFISRDPIAYEAGDVNLYRYVGNAPIEALDPFGLQWTVVRDGNIRARASTDSCDTVADLATLIGLNADEYQLWLQSEDGGGLPESTKEPVLPTRIFSVPNEGHIHVSTYTAGFLGWGLIGYKNGLVDRWEADGLKVTKVLFARREDILFQLRSAHLYRYAYIGHGDRGGILVPGTLHTGGDDFILASRYTLFGINEMHLIACHSNDSANMWRRNVSAGGFLRTIRGRGSIVHFLFQWSNIVHEHGR